ncbi:uncharacterized protein BT62DRAFT_384874 [Guyanagaster necrorhizus]|uniref:F-box domain-containing protein n=1 Tax=Guyanagaster necrorhizus TaxID=856835 RepID=A0A9P7VLE0_9AGAR|nr:uncharacterized protein BT62DRAFT_384874 [Guyanagaster necrorhizus MCA 3950]KAG7442485.1 hypothetical protein BT62DRAFT_384874 [Guyanagaster necrorhizus MCA 3950]
MPDLPQELFDTIIDKLQQDRKSLMACSLASRIFLPRTRFHLFRNVVLNETFSQKFHKLVVSSPNIARNVTDLTFFGDVFKERLVLPVVHSLVNLSTLSLQDMDFDNVPRYNAGIFDAFSHLPIKHISMLSLCFHDFSTAIRTSFPFVQSLTMWDVVGRSNPEPSRQSCPLQVLKIHFREMGRSILDSIASGGLGALDHLHTLSTSGCPHDGDLSIFLKLMGTPSLRTLELRDLQCDDDSFAAPMSISLSHLRSIVFHVIQFGSDRPHNHGVGIQWLTGCFALAPNPDASAQNIVIKYSLFVGAEYVSVYERKKWAALNEVLSRSPVASLVSVRVIIRRYHDRAQTFDTIMSNCPCLRKMGRAFKLDIVEEFNHI